MRIVEKLPRTWREVENVWIPVGRTGQRMAARLWLPDGAETRPVPAILTYLPYRKRDSTRAGDDPMHRYFAGHGYACLRVDMRGAGDSDGLMDDEYAAQELNDGKGLIAWIAAQPWCTGKVGMIGSSWGGFNALQIAALRPPALKAIVTNCSTDDRYTDDMHWMGGCLLNDTLDWGSSFFARLHRPPDPEIAGGNWRAMWMERLEQVAHPLETWVRHQRRDSYWKHGSVNEDYGAIRCAVFATGGWMDGYSNAVHRLLANLKVPRLGLIGPWAHKYGHQAAPGPAIGYLQECMRWWDHWLKGRDTGIMNEPMLRVWMQQEVPPKGDYPTCPGRWVAEPHWPAPAIKPRKLHLNAGGALGARAGKATTLRHASDQTVGLAGGEWCPHGIGGSGPQYPTDQREDDARSLVFETGPLTSPVEILGQPSVTLALAVDKPVAYVAVRLNDVFPDGHVARASFGVLNLTHRKSHEFPEPMAPGKRTTVRVALNDIAYSFRPGHRIRVAISTTYWPMVWPAPEPVTLSLATGRSTLELPIRRPRASDRRIAFGTPEQGPPMAKSVVEPPSFHRIIEKDVGTGTVTIRAEENDGRYVIGDTGVEVGRWVKERVAITEGDPLSAVTEMGSTFSYRKGAWDTKVQGTCTLRATKTTWLLSAHLTAREGDKKVFERKLDKTIKRDLV
ncbi:MAG: CocE/NonD family hydrolase [Alphaproteobacteria bacterium]